MTALKEHEERLKSTYSSLGSNFYQMNEKTLTNLRVNLTRNSFEEVKGKDLFETDSLNYSYSDAIRQRVTHFPIRSEQRQFLQLFDKDKLIAGYLEGNVTVSQVLYSIREDGRACFVNISASMTRHPLTGDVVAFITEQECNSEKVKETLTNKILAEQFDMVAYLMDGKYGVTIGEAAKVKHGSIFPTSNSGDYQTYLDNQVYPVLSGEEEQRAEMIEALSLKVVGEQLKTREPYVVNISIEMNGETYYKQFDYYRVDPEAEFYILLKSDTTEIQKEHLEKIGGNARHLLGLINDILDMSRIESGRMTIKNEEFSFSEMLEQINTMVGSQCQDRGLTYDFRIIGRVDDFYIGDAMKLKQVIINILGNAVKFTPAPGTISFIVERTAEFDGQSTLKFIMKDTGIGMDKEYLPKIFEAFSQENEGKANKYGSTGLGMAITKNIVEMMNGRIIVESEKGVGSTFTVNVTLRNSDRKTRQMGDVNPQDLKVLVIDDDEVACEHATIVLEEIGIAADTAKSGKEAIEIIQLKAARREEYNLIFVDWKMPEQDGVEVTREIRKIIGSESAVIVLTAYNWDDIIEEATEAGVDSFMSKPLFASSVLSAFQQAMSNKQAAVEEKPLADLTGRKVLLAEDMLINAEIMKELLKMKEIEVDHAENGQLAVDMFRDSAPGTYDAILMDVRMPVLDGLGAMEAIRALEREDAKNVPIIAMTANAFDEDVQRSLQAGMSAHLTKPVEPERLYTTLGELIQD